MKYLHTHALFTHNLKSNNPCMLYQPNLKRITVGVSKLMLQDLFMQYCNPWIQVCPLPNSTTLGLWWLRSVVSFASQDRVNKSYCFSFFLIDTPDTEKKEYTDHNVITLCFVSPRSQCDPTYDASQPGS